MKTLYISDLDGTLLNRDAELSPRTIDIINSLIRQGEHFTIATARSAASVNSILAPLHLTIPVIFMNGVLIYHTETGKYSKVHKLPPRALKEIIALVYESLKAVSNIATAFYKDIYSAKDNWFLEIFSQEATKYKAAVYLRAHYHYEYLAGFGYNLNDIPLFQACDETCAVANANEELKAVSDRIIGVNWEDGVANWLKRTVLKHTYFYDTPVGRLGISEKNAAITEVYFSDDVSLEKSCYIEETPLIQEAGKQLAEYFQGLRKSFDLPLAPEGTSFQRTVWELLKTIPYGETWSYKRIAEAAGSPKGSRAVGMANNKNPIVILIPCHRVIGANGSLVGYGGGLERKELLLKLEAEHAKEENSWRN